MEMKWEELVQKAAIDSLDQDIKGVFAEGLHKTVLHGEASYDEQQVELLGDRILCLPHEGIALLFGEYFFHLGFEGCKKLFDIENARGKIRYYKDLINLSHYHKYCSTFSDSALTEACTVAMESYMSAENDVRQNEETEPMERTTVRHELGTKPGTAYMSASPNETHIIKARHKLRFRYICRTALIAILMMVLLFSTFMVVNAEFRTRIVSWFVETYEDNSLFMTVGETEHVDLHGYSFSYIPEGAKLTDSFDSSGIVNYKYEIGESDYVMIYITQSGTSIFSNTEGTEVKPIKVNGYSGFWFEKELMGNIVFEREGTQFLVCGTVGKDELIKIASGITE